MLYSRKALLALIATAAVTVTPGCECEPTSTKAGTNDGPDGSVPQEEEMKKLKDANDKLSTEINTLKANQSSALTNENLLKEAGKLPDAEKKTLASEIIKLEVATAETELITKMKDQAKTMCNLLPKEKAKQEKETKASLLPAKHDAVAQHFTHYENIKNVKSVLEAFAKGLTADSVKGGTCDPKNNSVSGNHNKVMSCFKTANTLKDEMDADISVCTKAVVKNGKWECETIETQKPSTLGFQLNAAHYNEAYEVLKAMFDASNICSTAAAQLATLATDRTVKISSTDNCTKNEADSDFQGIHGGVELKIDAESGFPEVKGISVYSRMKPASENVCLQERAWDVITGNKAFMKNNSNNVEIVTSEKSYKACGVNFRRTYVNNMVDALRRDVLIALASKPYRSGHIFPNDEYLESTKAEREFGAADAILNLVNQETGDFKKTET